MPDQPLLIFDLEGTLGYIPGWEASKSPLILRPGLVDGLKTLKTSPKNYNLALATTASLDVAAIFIDYVRQQGFEFDSIDDRTSTSLALPKGFKDRGRALKYLSSVYARYGVAPNQIPLRVLVIEDIQLDPNDIFVGDKTFVHPEGSSPETKRAEDLLIQGSQWNVYGNPFPKESYVPTVLLVPHLFKARDFLTFPMNEVIRVIDDLYLAGEGDFEQAYHRVHQGNLIPIQTNLHRIRGDDYSLRKNPDARKHPLIQELLQPFQHRYLIMRGGSFPTAPCDRIEL